MTSTSGRVDVDAVDPNRPRDARAVDQVVHAIEAAQQRGLAAAGRPDEGGDLASGMFDVETSCSACDLP